jgi:hypothetical protein
MPMQARHAVKMLVAHWFDYRTPVIDGTIVAEVPLAVSSMLQQLSVGHYPLARSSG